MRPRFLAAFLLALATALAAGCAESPDGERIVHSERSAYQTIVVTDSDERRCLRFGDAGQSRLTQSCRLHAHPEHLAFHYTRAMTAVLLLWQPAPQRVLVIGVGGGSIPMALAAVRPAMDVDAVDIDPAVLRVATRFFGVRPGPRLRLHAVDGAAFVAEARARGRTYDAVLLDAFDENGVPPALVGEAFLRDVQAVLAPEGVFLANTVAGPAHERELAAASAVFGRFHTIRPAPWTNNRLLVAARDPSGLPGAAGLFAGAARHGGELKRLGIDEPWLRQLEIVGAGFLPDRAGDASGPMMPDARMRDGMPALPKVLSEPRGPAGTAR